jgi:hypothetical protein
MILTKLFKCGHTYYRDPAANRYYVTDASTAASGAVQIDTTRPIIIGDCGGISLPLADGGATPISGIEAAAAVLNLGMTVRLGELGDHVILTQAD